jgi:thiamine biosynthesis lipoprotein
MMLRGKAFRVEQHMGMPFGIDIRDAAAHEDPESVERLLDACFADLQQADDTFSLWRSDTPMARLNAGRTQLADLPTDAVQVLRLCARWQAATDGWFSARRPDGAVDPSGLVKSWAVRRVGRRLLAAGMRHWCVNAAGDVLVHGQARPGEGWVVGIQHPLRTGLILDSVTLTAGAVATSGPAARGEHVWNPKSARPARGVVSATVVARDIVTADVLATAAVARGWAAGWLEAEPGLEACLVDDDGAIRATSGWPCAG